jgi:prepilin-type N-terminal cleavage/methylation domain-containing protein
MIYHRHSYGHGFTLYEVMIALAIMGFALAALSSLQIGLMRSVVRATERFDRMRYMNFFWQESRIKEDKDKEKKLTKMVREPEIALSYERTSPAKSSSLYKIDNLELKGLALERIEARWPIVGGESQDTMISFIYNPERKHESRNKLS